MRASSHASPNGLVSLNSRQPTPSNILNLVPKMTSLSTETIVAIVALPIGLSLSALAIYIAYLQLHAARPNRAQSDIESLPLVDNPEAMIMGPAQLEPPFESQHQVQYQMSRWERRLVTTPGYLSPGSQTA
ncbi:hypothetical protein FALCPG4_003639 [Fusarium falciforme]